MWFKINIMWPIRTRQKDKSKIEIISSYKVQPLYSCIWTYSSLNLNKKKKNESTSKRGKIIDRLNWYEVKRQKGEGIKGRRMLENFVYTFSLSLTNSMCIFMKWKENLFQTSIIILVKSSTPNQRKSLKLLMKKRQCKFKIGKVGRIVWNLLV